jgi:hypothetical protein cdiviTM7_02674
MVEINLLPDVKRDLLKAQQLRNIVTFVSIVIGGAMLAGVVLLFLTTKGQELLMSLKTSEISNKFADMQKIQDGETAATLRNQLNAIQKIRNASPDTSRLIGTILPAIQTTGENAVQFSALNYDPETRIVSIEGQTNNGFPALEAFIKTIKYSQIIYDGKDSQCKASEVEKDANICMIAEEGSVTRTESSLGTNDQGQSVLRFAINFKLNEAALKFSSKNFAVKTLGRKNVTDSTIQVPAGIFTQNSKKDSEKENK